MGDSQSASSISHRIKAASMRQVPVMKLTAPFYHHMYTTIVPSTLC